ncbi:MAG TPA: hypothetical protein VLC08_04140 [Chitinolyticbacter sp.]|nr:hypothetical protein [Chitinolyticbacter sp.]
MGKLKILLGTLLVLVLIVAALPLLLPANLYSDPVIAMGQKMTHGKFEVKRVSFEYYPKPAVVLENVVLESAERASIDRILIPLTAKNVLAWGETLQGIVVEGGRFSPDYAAQLPHKLKPEPDTPRLTTLSLERTSVALGKSQLGPVSGMLKFGTSGELTELEINDNTGQLELLVQPHGEGQFAVQLNATGWEVPLGYPAKFDFLRLKGIAHANGIDIEEIRGDLYGGVITGSAQLTWTEGWQLAGTLRGSGVQAELLSKVFSSNTYATGRLEAEARFVYQADGYAKLFENAGIDATLLVRDGVLHNFDLVTPLKSSTPVTYSRGGQTRFATVSGKLAVRGKDVQFSGMKIDGGKFSANGHLRIGEGQKLAGVVASKLSSGAIAVSNQIRVAGTLPAPEFRTGAAFRPRAGEEALAAPAQ